MHAYVDQTLITTGDSKGNTLKKRLGADKDEVLGTCGLNNIKLATNKCFCRIYLLWMLGKHIGNRQVAMYTSRSFYKLQFVLMIFTRTEAHTAAVKSKGKRDTNPCSLLLRISTQKSAPAATVRRNKINEWF